MINDNCFKCLLDSGSMVSTISQSAFQSLNPNVHLHPLDSLGLTLSVADGSSLIYSGYSTVAISIPLLSSFSLDIPVLVIPDNAINNSSPVIVGTNVLCRCKTFLTKSADEITIPTDWRLAIDSLDTRTYPLIVCGKKNIIITPFESITINGIARNVEYSISSVITETPDAVRGFIAFSRVVNLHDTTDAKVPVRICNVTNKTLTLKPKSVLCTIFEDKVIGDITSAMSIE